MGNERDKLKAGEYLADGRFRLLERVGKGGWATVWRAHDQAAADDVAIKILRAENLDKLDRFVRSAIKTAGLSHPGIVRVLVEHEVHEGHHFYVQEYLPGGDLHRLVLEGRLPVEDGMRVIGSVAEALEYAHRAGLIHGNVSPHQIIFTEAGSPKLTDFELDRGPKGKPAYASMEALSQPHLADPRSDIYSLAKTAMFCILRKDLPDEALTSIETFIAGLDCPGDAKAVLSRATSERPEDRHPTAVEFAGELLHAFFAAKTRKPAGADRAPAASRAPLDVDPNDLAGLRDAAESHYRKEQWDQAFKHYQLILAHHRDRLAPNDLADIFFRLGRIKQVQAEWPKALNMFDKALEIDPHHRATIEELIALHLGQKDIERVIHFKTLLAEASRSRDEAFALLVEIGDLWQDELRNPGKALQSYLEAKELRDKDPALLHKLIAHYTSTRQWPEAVETLEEVASVEKDQGRAAKYHFSIGVIYRDELRNADQAVEAFDRSLDLSPENLKAFEAIERILTGQEDWKALERSYRRMLRRIAGKGRKELEINLWHFLGEIYRTRLQQLEPAAEAFRTAARLDPDNVPRHELLADLFLALPGKTADAVEEYQWLIGLDPYRIEPYKALRKLYADGKQYDKAWCLCATLSFLKKADPEEQQFFEQHRTRGLVRAQARLDNERWVKDLFHPQEDPVLGKLFESMLPAVRKVRIQPIKKFGLKKTERSDPATDTVMLSKTFGYCGQVLNLPRIPELYLQPDQPGGLRYVIIDPMASVAGANVLSGYSPQEVTFMVAKHLAYYRPEHYIRWILSAHEELWGFFLASIQLAEPDFETPPDPSGAAEPWVAKLKKQLSPAALEQLELLVPKVRGSATEAGLRRWLNAVELTACRAGLLLCNDLEVAARMIQAEALGVVEIAPKDKLKDLVVFSVSEPYFRLREHLGIQAGA